MAENVAWPPLSSRKVIGQSYRRLDGIEKASGRAKYNSDLIKPGQLWASIVSSPHAHAKVKSVDLSAAEQMPGVKGIEVVSPAGTEIQWAGTEIAFVAAESEEQARDAARAVKVEYEVLEHFVQDEDPKKVGSRLKAAGEKIEGDPEKAFKEAEVVIDGYYAIPALAHCCLEPHGNLIDWNGGKVEYNPSTQAVTSIQGDLARQLSVPAANVHVHMDYIGGGFGSKFQADRWGIASAAISKKTGRPVKVFLERSEEVVIAGVRPSAYAKIKLGASKDGTVTAWESDSWASGGITGGGSPPLPYVFTKIANQRLTHNAVALNTAPIRAWRAPNHPQASFLTCSAMEDMAAKLNMDPLDFFIKNAALTTRPDTYIRQLKKAAEMAEWKKNWHPRGQSGSGPLKRGLGIGVGTWNGLGHASSCRTNIHPDGSVEVELGSQDLGTGTRTAIAQVAAETFGLKHTDIKVKIGDTAYPPSGTSGGSTTIGGVSTSTLKSTVAARQKLFDVAASALNVQPDQLEAVGGKIQVKGNATKGLTWKAACQKLGVTPISVTAENNPRTLRQEKLADGGTGGVQIADVTVDIETGVVKMNKMVAVQDCGLIVNPRLAESQVLGACIMMICGALMEERIADQVTGQVLNADMEFYKLAGIKDIGEIEVHMEVDPENDARGVIGLGEPPTIPGIAAISNAVANAVGKRVPRVPFTPDHVLATLYGDGRNS